MPCSGRNAKVTFERENIAFTDSSSQDCSGLLRLGLESISLGVLEIRLCSHFIQGYFGDNLNI